jgi:hypothetical protein
VLSQHKFLTAIKNDLRVRRAEIHERGVDGQNETYLEWSALVRYQRRVHDAGDDQSKLEAIVASLEKQGGLCGGQRWRERSTV